MRYLNSSFLKTITTGVFLVNKAYPIGYKDFVKSFSSFTSLTQRVLIFSFCVSKENKGLILSPIKTPNKKYIKFSKVAVCSIELIKEFITCLFKQNYNTKGGLK